MNKSDLYRILENIPNNIEIKFKAINEDDNYDDLELAFFDPTQKDVLNIILLSPEC